MKKASWRKLPVVAAAIAGAMLWASGHPSKAADSALLLKALGTTENINPMVLEAFDRASKPLSDADRELALKCWKNNVCDTGRGTVTVALADGSGENVWRQVTHMEFVMQALMYPDVRKIIYTSAQGDASKAISDMRGLIAQKVNVIATFPDAGEALLPTVKEATEQGIVVVPYIAGLGGQAGKDWNEGDIAGIDLDRPETRTSDGLNFDAFTECTLQKLLQAIQEIIQIDGFGSSACRRENASRRLVSAAALCAPRLALASARCRFTLPARPRLFRSAVSRLPSTIIRRLLKSCAMPPLSWPTASSF